MKRAVIQFSYTCTQSVLLLVCNSGDWRSHDLKTGGATSRITDGPLFSLSVTAIFNLISFFLLRHSSKLCDFDSSTNNQLWACFIICTLTILFLHIILGGRNSQQPHCLQLPTQLLTRLRKNRWFYFESQRCCKILYMDNILFDVQN